MNQEPRFELKPSLFPEVENHEPPEGYVPPDKGYKEITLAKCGANCTECIFSLEGDCPGCMQGHPFEEEECDVYDCCTKKGYLHCGECRDFPCENLKELSYDPDTGDEGDRIMRLKDLSDSESDAISRFFMTGFTSLALGFFAGLTLGTFTGAVGAWCFAGTLLGGAAGAIILISKGKK